MSLLDASLAALGSLAWLAVMFVPLERAFPARRRQPVFRRTLLTDLAFFCGEHVLFAALAVSLIGLLGDGLATLGPLSSIRSSFATQPPWLRVVELVLLGDFVAYWGHRLQHGVPLLWRFHVVHHTSEELDWLAGHREHPLDGLYTLAASNLPALVLGLSLEGFMGFVAFRASWTVFLHSNVQIPLGPLRYVLGSPALHRGHHARDRHAGNYASFSPWLDLLFGTYRGPDHAPDRLGAEDGLPTSYLGLVLSPFWPRSSRRADSGSGRRLRTPVDEAPSHRSGRVLLHADERQEREFIGPEAAHQGGGRCGQGPLRQHGAGGQ